MITRTWHKGPPPHVGWWNASKSRQQDIWRWWNGSAWSENANSENSFEYAARYARIVAPDHHQERIEWSDYWPENARVPRVNPNEVEA